jgi:AraC-like DNA-binding protein
MLQTANAESPPVATPLSDSFRERLLFRTKDLDEAREKVADIYRPHKLNFKRASKKLDTSFYHIPLFKTSINWLGYGSDMVINPGELEDFFLVQMPTRGGGDVVCGKQHMLTNTRRGSVLNPTERIKLIWDAECWKVQVRLNRGLMERSLSALLERPVNEPIIFKLAMDMQSSAGQTWCNAVRFVADEVPLLRQLPNNELMIRQLEQLLVTTLLHTQPHNYSDELFHKLPNIAPRHVKRAEDYIVTHCREAVTIDDLVEVTGVSARTLYKGFQNFRGVSPMKFLKATRLDKVHEALKEADASGCVTQIAMEFGFRQLGRFAMEYRQRFGEFPSETLKR